MRRASRRWAIFVLVQIVVCAVVLELGLRIAYPYHTGLRALLYSPTVRTEYDRIDSTGELLRTTVLGLRPGEKVRGFVLNSQGFRTPEYTAEPQPGTLRLVVLGDSFAFASGGVPWSLMWTTRLEESLAARLQRPVEVINLGVPAIGPRFELRLWELEGARLDPAWVVLGFFIGNDFTDESGHPLEPARDEALARWSYTYRLGRNLSRLWRERRENRIAQPTAEVPGREGRSGYEAPGAADLLAQHTGLSETAYLKVELNRLALCRRSRREGFEELFAKTTPVLLHLASSVRRHGAELVVAMIPDEYQVDGSLLQRLLEDHGIPAEDIDLTYPQRRLATFLESEGIPYLDLLPELRRHAANERLYWPTDTHWNPSGNRVAGDLLAEFLAARVP